MLKAIAPHTFYAHLLSLGWVPSRFLKLAVSLSAGLEFGWGLVLFLGVFPRVTYPITVVLLIVLTGISWWNVKTGLATDCGCYGGFVQPSIGQSVAINTFLVLLVAASWRALPPSFDFAGWQILVVIVGGAGVGILAESAQRYRYTHVRPMFDTNPLKEGRQWRHSWAAGVTAGWEGEFLVTYLGTDCPHCKQFVRVANVMSQSPLLPRIAGVMAATEAARHKYIADNEVLFPIASISHSLMGRVAEEVPTTVLVRGGMIERMWMGSIPPDYVGKLRAAFFPEADIASKLEAST